MKITNRQALPEAIVEAAREGTREPVPHRYSVTELIKPTHQALLEREVWDRLEEDVADCVPALLGTAFHSLMEAHTEGESEVQFETQVGSATLTGRADLVAGDNIEDWKTCSVSKVAKADFTDWEKQGLAYAWLRYRCRDEVTRKLRFIAVMKDWSKVQASTRPGYPQSPIFVWEREVADSDYDYIGEWVKLRVAALEAGSADVCSQEERWNDGDKWAVYKKAGDKRAFKVCDSEAEARDTAASIGPDATIELREGQDLKCDLYCPCRRFCEWKNSRKR